MIHIPSSKSYTQRAIFVAALASGPSVVRRALRCDDSAVLMVALQAFGVRFEWAEEDLKIYPPVQLGIPSAPLQLGNCGTAARFVAALSLLAEGAFTLDGAPRMRERPMRGLFTALVELGVQVQGLGEENRLPVTLVSIQSCHREEPAIGRRRGDPDDKLDGHALRARHDTIHIDDSASSQPLSALLMAAPCLPNGLHIKVEGTLPSAPYVEMTIDVMHRFGVTVEREGNNYWAKPQRYQPTEFAVEGDWSSAAFWLIVGLITGREIPITNLKMDSIQGDRAIVGIIDQLRSGQDLILNMGETPDLVPAVVIGGLFRRNRLTITGVAHLRGKESDRLQGLATELKKIGADITEYPDSLTITPAPLHGGVTLNPQADHRLAMAFGLLTLKWPSVHILNKECVRKSYPDFWESLKTIP